MPSPTSAIEYANANRERFVAELRELLAIPSVSTLSQHKPDMLRAADWVANNLRGFGLQNVAILPTPGHPVVYGEWLNAPGQPTVLIYGHYDVQPIEPLNEWVSPAFEPTLRGDNLYARGASDMKGQVMGFLKALDSILKTGPLPVNVKVMIEGEEEIGSPNLGAFVQANLARLKCDIALNADVAIVSPTQPSLVFGLRGLAYFELWVHGAKADLHSGTFGGSVHNPAQVLCELIAGMHDANGHITLPGFYDAVRELTPDERANLAGETLEEWNQMVGAPQLYGEKGYNHLEQTGSRPTLEINGLYSGFIGEGSKTVLPAKAMAKISCRLVPYQDDTKIEGMLRAYLEKHAPPTVTWKLSTHSTTPAVLVEQDSPGIRAAMAALEATFGVKPVFRMEGGSVPVVSMTQKLLGVDSILMGFGLPDDNLHAPNEKLHLPNYYHGIESYIRFFHNLAQ